MIPERIRNPGRSKFSSLHEPWDLAIQHLNRRRIREALDHFHSAEQAGYDSDQCAAGRWECHMLLGDFASAWEESDAIASRGAPDANRFWDGEPFTGRRVMLRTLHGFGDAIQFIRYAPLLRARAKSLVVQTHPELVSLFEPVPSIDRVITWGEDAAWDQQIEVMELPRAFRTTVATIPDTIPYIPVTRDLCEQQRARALGADKGSDKLKAGVVWAASQYNPARNMRLSDLEPLLAHPQLQCFSFQRGPERSELAQLAERYDVRDMYVDDPQIAICAAGLMQMDVVITVDTMVAHLAGALGKPVYTLLHDQADWRWMLDREDTPWYPTMRLIRQRTPGDWSSAVERVMQAITEPRGSLIGRGR